MGLVRMDGSVKPAGEAFRFAARTLVPLGPAHRVDDGDPALFHFRYGENVHVIWGTPRGFTAQGPDVRVLTATGAPVTTTQVGDQPLVIIGARALTFGARRVLADSLYGYGQHPLEWAARRTDGNPLPLRPVDWQWSSYLGNSALPLALVNPQGMAAPAGTAMLVRYRAAAPAPLFASACLAVQPGAPARAAIERNGVPVWNGAITGASPLQITQRLPIVSAGDRIDLVITPATAAPVRLRYRWRLSLDPADPAPCPEERQS